MAKSKKSVDDFIIDFSKEEKGGGGGARYKPGTYLVKVLKAKPTTSAEKGSIGLEVTFVFTEGKLKGKKMVDTLWASPKAYSRFRTLLEACGKKVPQKVNLVRIAKAIKGEELYITIDDEERKGYKTRSRVQFDGFISVDDFDEDDEDGDDEEDDDEDDEDLDDDDEEEDDEEDDEDEDEDDEDEEDEEDEEEEEPVRKKKSSKSKKASAKKSKAKSKKKKSDDDDEDDDLDDLDLDEL